MSRRIAISLICLVLLLSATTAWIWFQYLRYPDMPPPTTQASDTLRIWPPTDAHCQNFIQELESRVILVRLHKNDLDERPAITVNADQLPGWPKAAEMLHAIYATRVTRVAFLQSDPGVNAQYVREMMDVLRKAEVTDICMVDPAMSPEIPVYRSVAQ